MAQGLQRGTDNGRVVPYKVRLQDFGSKPCARRHGRHAHSVSGDVPPTHAAVSPEMCMYNRLSEGPMISGIALHCRFPQRICRRRWARQSQCSCQTWKPIHGLRATSAPLQHNQPGKIVLMVSDCHCKTVTANKNDP